MNQQQPEALRLADALFRHASMSTRDDAAAELRRQHAENKELRAEVEEWRKLKDPVKLHVSLLAGKPARLEREIFLHLGGADQLIEQNEALRRDAERLAYVYSGKRTDSDALVNIELRLLNGDVPTIQEVRAAIDAAREVKT